MPISLRKRSRLKRIISAFLSGLLAFFSLGSLLISPDAASAATISKTVVVQNSDINTTAVKGQAVTSQIPDLYYNTAQLTLGNDTIEVRPYIQFDLSSIPADATLTNATLELTSINSFVNRNNVSATVAVYKVMGAWDENTITWSKAPAFAPDPVLTQQVNGYATASKTQFDLTSLAQQWVDGVVPNYGIVLRSEHFSSGNWVRRYYSDENLTFGPKLTVTYTVNDLTVTPSQLSLVKGGSGGQLTVRFDPDDGTTPSVTWATYDSSVATVDGFGYVTPGNTPGTTTIIATTGDGRKAISTVTVSASSSAALNNLTLSQGTLTPAFDGATTSYSATVPRSVDSISVTPTSSDPDATVTVNGQPVTSGSASQPIALQVGPNTITTVVKSAAGTKQKSYSVIVYRQESTNADLSGLTLSQGTLSPAFSSGLKGYSATVAHSVASVDVTPTAAGPNAAITVNEQPVASGSPLTVPLNVGINIVKVIVTAEDGTSQKLYTVTITRPPSTNADLSGLLLSEGTMSPAFGSGALSYGISVGNRVTSIAVTPTTADANATVTVNGQSLASGSHSANIPLNVGDNAINVTVTAQDGTTKKTYTVTVNRAASNVAYLSNLTMSEGSLAPAFGWNVYAYRVVVANQFADITVTPTTTDANANVKVNGQIVANGSPSANIPLSVGDNTINVTVTAEDGKTTQTYTVTVNRAPSANANLNNLSLSEGTLSPAFARGVTAYSAAVPNSVGSLTVRPTVAEANATVAVNETKVASATASQAIPLEVGDNVITVTVTAQDGKTTKTYKVTVTRAPSNSADLTYLKLSDGALLPAFGIGTTSYSATVANSVYKLTVTPTAADPAATIKVNGTEIASETASQEILLNVGDNNVITVTVTAPDGTTTKTYTVSVTRAASNSADLSNLELSEGGLSPVFASGVTNYTSTLANHPASLKITPTAADPTATVTVNDTPAVSGAPFGPIPLKAGENEIKVTVTAQDGKTTKTYTVIVTRPASSNADLSNLSLSSGSLNPVFASGVTNYTATVENGVTSVTVNPTASDPTASLVVNDNPVASGGASQSIPLNVGDNEIKVTVTAQDGKTTKTYTVIVTRPASSSADLSNLSLSSGSLNPVFASGVTNYTAIVENGVASVTVNPTASDPTATLVVNDNPVASGGASQPIPLNVGDNEIKVTVTAQDGKSKTYTIVITRKPATPTPTPTDDGVSDSSDSDSGGSGSSSGGGVWTPTAPVNPTNPPVDKPDMDKPSEQSGGAACTKLTWTDIQNHWAKSDIESASQLCVVQGPSSDKFLPDNEVTRLQFALMVARAMKLQAAGNASILEAFADRQDVPDWAVAELSVAARAGIIEGYDDNTLRPNEKISRAEMVTMLIRGWKMSAAITATSFADDADIPEWAKGYVAKAEKEGIIVGRSNNRFEPSSTATRAEATVVLVRMLKDKL